MHYVFKFTLICTCYEVPPIKDSSHRLSCKNPLNFYSLIPQPAAWQIVPGCVFPVVIHAVLLLATLLSDMILFEKQVKGRVASQF
jgi:hypothetical protein